MATVTLTVYGPNAKSEVTLPTTGVVIGRGPKCDVVLDSERVSRRHARIFQDPFGRWIIEDLDSSNGVFVAGERVRARAVLPGEKIIIAPFTLTVSAPPEQEIAPDPSVSSTTLLLDEAADLHVEHAASKSDTPLTHIWLEELNVIVDRLAALTSPAELYPEVCRGLATGPGTAALVVRVPAADEPLPNSPQVLACQFGGQAEAPVPDRPNLHLSRRVLEAIRATREPVMARSLQAADGQLSLTVRDAHTPRAVLCAPVNEGEGAVEAVYLDVPFDEAAREVFDFVRAVARQVRIVRRSLLLVEFKAQRRALDYQLALARTIQAKLTPRAAPSVPGVDVAMHYAPAMWVGGDYCDVWVRPDGRLACAIGDVSGKGLPAALVMANLQAALRTATAFCAGPSEVTEHVNRHLVQHLPEDMFVTLFFGLLDPANGRLEFVNAGHIPPLLIGAGGDLNPLGQPDNPVLGVSCERFTTDAADIAPGMALLAVTDGITEAPSPAGEEFGLERLARFLRTVRIHSAQQLVRAAITAVTRFRRGRAQQDDVTALALVRSATEI